MPIAILLAFALVAIARGEEHGLLTVPLRLDRTVITDSVNTVDFGAGGLPDLMGRVVTGHAPGGVPLTAKRVEHGYLLVVAGATQLIPLGGSIAVEVHGLPYVVRNDGRSLQWIPHYQAEGVLAVGPCRERVVVFDDNANGSFDDLSGSGFLGIDLYRDGRLRFGRSFEFCGRLLSAERVAADGSSITFRRGPIFLPQIGTAAPAITLATLDGEVVKPGNRRPKPLLLDFWASWCSVCLGEFPTLRKLHDSGEVQLVSINIDDPAQAGAARAILQQQKPRWAQVLTGQGTATSAWQVFESLTYAGGMPLYALIDRSGVLRYAGTGGGTELPEVKAALAKLPTEASAP
jgi:thiol-disulfide isomerase/thioredoxin